MAHSIVLQAELDRLQITRNAARQDSLSQAARVRGGSGSQQQAQNAQANFLSLEKQLTSLRSRLSAAQIEDNTQLPIQEQITETVIEDILLATPTTQELPVTQQDNTVRNALLIGGALVLLL